MSVMSDASVTYDAALEYADRGWHVLACKPGGKDPYFPFAPNAYKSATTDPAKIGSWFEKNPTINIGIAAAQSGLIVIDLDYRNFTGKAEQLEARLVADHPTYTVKTGDGFHLYYRADNLPQWVPGKIVDGIDVKYRGYVVAAPSRHPSGAFYREIDDRDPAPLPAWILKAALR